MKRNRRLGLALALLLCMIVTACSAILETGEEKTEFEVGEKVSSYWFDFTVNRVEATDSYGGYAAGKGYQLVVCDMTIKNTFDEAIPMGWGDFVLLWERPEDDSTSAAASMGDLDGVYPLSQYTDEQLPDEYDLERWATEQGVLVFKVPDEVTEVAVMFQELYAEVESEIEYSEGNSYLVWAEL